MAASTLNKISSVSLEKAADCVVINEEEGSLLAVSSPGREINIFRRNEHENGDVYFEKTLSHVLPFPSECLQFGEDGKTLAAGTMSGSLILLDIEKGSSITCSPEGRRTNIIQLCQDPDQPRVWASASLDSTIRLFDTRQRNEITSYQLDVKRMNALRYSPNGEFLALGTEDCQVKVVSAMDGKPYGNFVGHSAPVCDVRFHPSEYLIASGSRDKTVRFWDLESLECVTQSHPLPGPVSRIFFEPEGASLFASTPKGIRALGWEPARIFCHLLPDESAENWNPPVILGLRPIEDRLISLSLSDDKKAIDLYAVDLESLRPFFVSPNGSPTSEFPSSLLTDPTEIPYDNDSSEESKNGNSEDVKTPGSVRTIDGNSNLSEPVSSDTLGSRVSKIQQPAKNSVSDSLSVSIETDSLTTTEATSKTGTSTLSTVAKPAIASLTPAGTPNMSRSRARRSFTRHSLDKSDSITILPSVPGAQDPSTPDTDLSAFKPRDKINRSPPPPPTPPVTGRKENGSSIPFPPQVSPPSTIPPGGLLPGALNTSQNQPPSSGTIYVQLPSPVTPSSAFVVRDAVKNPAPPITGARPTNRKTTGAASPNVTRKPSGGPNPQDSAKSPKNTPSSVGTPSRTGKKVPAIATVSPQPVANRRPAAASLNPVSSANQRSAATSGNDTSFSISPFGKPQAEVARKTSDYGATYNIPTSGSAMLLPGANPDSDLRHIDLGATYEIPKEHSIFHRNQAPSYGGKLSPGDFLPAHLSGSLSLSSAGAPSPGAMRYGGFNSTMGEMDCFDILQKDSSLITAVLSHRVKSLQTVQRVWARDGARRAVEVAISSTDPAILVEVLKLLNQKSNLWSLDYCSMLLPHIRALVVGDSGASAQARDSYIETAVASLRLIINGFGNVIRHGLSRAPSIGTDVEGEARMSKCRGCVSELVAIRNGVAQRQKLGDLSKCNERTTRNFREINVLLQILEG